MQPLTVAAGIEARAGAARGRANNGLNRLQQLLLYCLAKISCSPHFTCCGNKIPSKSSKIITKQIVFYFLFVLFLKNEEQEFA